MPPFLQLQDIGAIVPELELVVFGMFLLIFDLLWSLSPFLLLHHINFGLALSCTVLLVYSPFAQRSLVLMGTAAGRTVAL